jgi:hypothetical protein
MSTILLTWELGRGLGHLVNLQPLAEGLLRRGHRIVAALRDFSGVHRVLPVEGVEYLQAPVALGSQRPIESPASFAQILCNCGFADADALAIRTDAWKNLFRYVKPDLIVCDHSPTALLASRGIVPRRATIGTGFFCPPDVAPLPHLQPWMPHDASRLLADEHLVLDNVNRVLVRSGEQMLSRVTQLYHPADEHFLLTFPELDPYGERVGAEYWGMWSGTLGTRHLWPNGQGQKIFAYLKPFPALPQLLHALAEIPNPALVYVSGIDPGLRRQHQRSNLCFADGPVNIPQVAAECDVAILNGTLGTATALLLVGKPTLQIPLFLEQGLAAIAIARMGAGAVANPSSQQEIVTGLRAMLIQNRFAAAAQAFAARHAGFDAPRQIDRLVDRAERLAAGNSSSA